MRVGRSERYSAQVLCASSYSRVAREYYDPLRHPTCANFREASRLYIDHVLGAVACFGFVTEIGAGESIAAGILNCNAPPFDRLILLDNSIEMLSYSQKYFGDRVLGVVSDALRLPFKDASMSTILCSLGDPYNVRAFWDEVARCLSPGGTCVFTVPSYEWAEPFRANSAAERPNWALFELSDGQEVYLPSLIRNVPDQIELIEAASLTVSGWKDITLELVPRPHSQKLAKAAAVITGYTVQKLSSCRLKRERWSRA